MVIMTITPKGRSVVPKARAVVLWSSKETQDHDPTAGEDSLHITQAKLLKQVASVRSTAEPPHKRTPPIPAAVRVEGNLRNWILFAPAGKTV